MNWRTVRVFIYSTFFDLTFDQEQEKVVDS